MQIKVHIITFCNLTKVHYWKMPNILHFFCFGVKITYEYLNMFKITPEWNHCAMSFNSRILASHGIDTLESTSYLDA